LAIHGLDDLGEHEAVPLTLEFDLCLNSRVKGGHLGVGVLAAIFGLDSVLPVGAEPGLAEASCALLLLGCQAFRLKRLEAVCLKPVFPRQIFFVPNSGPPFEYQAVERRKKETAGHRIETEEQREFHYDRQV
jgi:hypothetical protein